MLVGKTMLQSCRQLNLKTILMENMFLLETESEEEREDLIDLQMILSSHRILLSSKSRDQIQRIKNLILTITLKKDSLLFLPRRNHNLSQSPTLEGGKLFLRSHQSSLEKSHLMGLKRKSLMTLNKSHHLKSSSSLYQPQQNHTHRKLEQFLTLRRRKTS